MVSRRCNAVLVSILSPAILSALVAPAAAERTGPYAAWENGPAAGNDFFPIAVWLQAPRNAPKYKAIGINLYVGLWNGPTGEQLAELKEHGMPVICDQNDYARAHLDEPIIVGWMHGDEPDNAQSLGRGKGYGPPVAPEVIVADYQKIKAADPTRPVMLNLGQGVAWDGYYGRGVRTNHPEDYSQYARRADVVSFDIYPAVHDKPAVAGKLWYVPRGVKRLRTWTDERKPVWNCIECTRISNVDVKPTPEQVKAEVWMSIIHGSQGLIYFSHQFQPKFVEAGLLADEAMARAVGEINGQVQRLASVINSPTVTGGLAVRCRPADVSPDLAELLGDGPVAAMVKELGPTTYVFAVRMEGSPARATFEMDAVAQGTPVEVIGENRTIRADRGRFEDDFDGHAVHLYKFGGNSR
jgi:hypothetical protein